jgi:hypothetical protein
VGWGKGAVLVGSANYEDGQVSGGGVNVYGIGQEQVAEVAGPWDSSVGPLAVADYDGDGELDLFAGGRVKGGQYPAPASSRLYHGRNGKLELDEANTARLRDVGLVSGAVWSDLDGDGWPDLILACEWGPVRVFHNDRGQLREVTRDLGLERFTGWWNGVTTGDLDGDGRMDIIASNWGGNSKYERYRKKPLRIYYGDFIQDGSVQLVESHFEAEMNKYVPSQSLERVTQAIPYLAARFPTHQAWAEAGIDEVIGDRRGSIRYCEADWLETTVFLNRGDHFEARVLPLEAQLAPCFAVCVADYNGDGNEDIFLGQNFFAVGGDTSRYDAGRGLLLEGDGNGGFRAVPGQESGVKVYGQQGGAAVCDYDEDGRTDLVVSQNGGETRLFHNVQAKPGLRVRLQGPDTNPRGIGAVVRLKFGSRLGPAREIHGGSGYWSQDSTIQVMGAPTEPTGIWVRWPGGRSVTADLPPKAKEVVVNVQGEVRQTR